MLHDKHKEIIHDKHVRTSLQNYTCKALGRSCRSVSLHFGRRTHIMSAFKATYRQRSGADNQWKFHQWVSGYMFQRLGYDLFLHMYIYIYMCTLSTLKCWPCMAILVSFKTPTSNLCFLLLLNLWPPKKLHINLFHLVAQKGLNRFKVACGRNVPLMDCGFEKGGS